MILVARCVGVADLCEAEGSAAAGSCCAKCLSPQQRRTCLTVSVMPSTLIGKRTRLSPHFHGSRPLSTHTHTHQGSLPRCVNSRDARLTGCVAGAFMAAPPVTTGRAQARRCPRRCGHPLSASCIAAFGRGPASQDDRREETFGGAERHLHIAAYTSNVDARVCSSLLRSLKRTLKAPHHRGPSRAAQRRSCSMCAVSPKIPPTPSAIASHCVEDHTPRGIGRFRFRAVSAHVPGGVFLATLLGPCTPLVLPPRRASEPSGQMSLAS